MNEKPETNRIPDPEDDMLYLGNDNEELINNKKSASAPPKVQTADSSPSFTVGDFVPSPSSPSPASQRRAAANPQPSSAMTKKRQIPVQQKVLSEIKAPSPASMRRAAPGAFANSSTTVNKRPAQKSENVPKKTVNRKPSSDSKDELNRIASQNRIPTVNGEKKSIRLSDVTPEKSVRKPAVSEAKRADAPVSQAPYAARRNQQSAPQETTTKKADISKLIQSADADKKPQSILPDKVSPEKDAIPDKKDKNKEKNKGKKKGPTAQGGADMMASIVKAILYMVVVVIIATFISIFIIKIGNDVFAFVKEDVAIDVTLPEGASIDDITDILYDNGIIKYPKIFRMYASLKHDEDGFIPGSYTVSPSMSYDELRNAFKEHIATGTSWITIPEGYSTDEIIDLMVSHDIGERDKYIDVINNYDFDFWFIDDLEKTGLKDGRAYRLEGYLFPDTYEFYNASSEEMVIKKMLTRFNEVFVHDYKTKASELGFSVDEILTLASMIEKEAGTTADYMKVSSVFHNRLRNFEIPRLDSDATIVYGIQIATGKRPNTITHDDLSFDTPYNTYTNPGLPPGPITNPSASAIRYALYPAATEFYYFVTADNGVAYYAESKEEHAANVEYVTSLNAKLAQG